MRRFIGFITGGSIKMVKKFKYLLSLALVGFILANCFFFTRKNTILKPTSPAVIINGSFIEPLKPGTDVRSIVSSKSNIELDSVQFSLNKFLVANSDKSTDSFKRLASPRTVETDCSESNFLLLALVIVAPGKLEQRDAIRNTWAHCSYNHSIRTVFYTGLSTNSTINDQIQEESIKYGDVLQDSFVDSYYNLTSKVMRAFSWALETCPRVPFILRINDDIVMNTPRVLDYLRKVNQTISSTPNLDQIMLGNLYPKSYVIRGKNSKFYVDKSLYKQNVYFPYCEGSAYFLTSRLAANLVNMSYYVEWPPFSIWLEDVYVIIII